MSAEAFKGSNEMAMKPTKVINLVVRITGCQCISCPKLSQIDLSYANINMFCCKSNVNGAVIIVSERYVF
jgi:hypothetical protein